jgi:hypothetical protein
MVEITGLVGRGKAGIPENLTRLERMRGIYQAWQFENATQSSPATILLGRHFLSR